jgi:LysM repeat protein
MPENDQDAAEVIESYRRRRERMVPILLVGLAVVLVVVGIFLIVIWVTGDGGPIIGGLGATETPTESPTQTPSPPTATPTITLTPTPSNTPTPEWPKSYIMELGDTLSSIAEQFGVTSDLIVAYNDIPDPDNVPIGTELIIPEPDSELPTLTPLPPDLKPGDKIEYVVRLGDNLASIAATFNTTAEAIAEENEIEDQNSLWAGTVLIITVGATPTPTLTPGPGTPTATTTS